MLFLKCECSRLPRLPHPPPAWEVTSKLCAESQIFPVFLCLDREMTQLCTQPDISVLGQLTRGYFFYLRHSSPSLFSVLSKSTPFSWNLLKESVLPTLSSTPTLGCPFPSWESLRSYTWFALTSGHLTLSSCLECLSAVRAETTTCSMKTFLLLCTLYSAATLRAHRLLSFRFALFDGHALGGPS